MEVWGNNAIYVGFSLFYDFVPTYPIFRVAYEGNE